MIITPKQMKICKLIAHDNLSNAEIGERLGNSKGAIEQHLVKLFKRHGFTSRYDIQKAILKFEVRDLRKKNV